METLATSGRQPDAAQHPVAYKTRRPAPVRDLALEQARVRALLSRTRAAELLGVDIARYSRAEMRGHQEPLRAQWLEVLCAQHKGLEIEPGIQPTPAAVRELRVRAGLTKTEAADVVGLSSGVGWHGYELGRYPVPAERWARFLDALRSGSYRLHVTDSYRRGPRRVATFVPGRLSREPKAAVVDAPFARAFACSRQAARLSAAAMAAALGVSASRLRAIERAKAPATAGHARAIQRLLEDRLLELEQMNPSVHAATDIAAARLTLRSSQDEIGVKVFLDAARPGAAISTYEAGSVRASAHRLAQIGGVVQALRLAQIDGVRIALQTLAPYVA